MSGMSDMKVLFFAPDATAVKEFIHRNEWKGIPYEFLKTKKKAAEVLKEADAKKHIYVIVTLLGWVKISWAEEIVIGFRDKGFVIL